MVEALRRLPAGQRVAVALHYLLGMPVADVAREVRAPVGTVKARLHRGRAALAELLAVDSGEAYQRPDRRAVAARPPRSCAARSATGSARSPPQWRW